MSSDRHIDIRVATEADAPVLAHVERNAPLEFGEGALVIDRCDDYFAAARLMEHATVLLATLDGEPAGVFCGALHHAVLGGELRRMLYIHHARILPSFQRSGIGRAFGARLREIYSGRVDSDYWYISPRNARSQAFAAAAQNKWSFGPLMVTLDAAANAGPSAGRPASEHDSGRVVDILNRFHHREEMFLPYTIERLSARLSRAPAQYSWSNLWLTEGAVVGAWPSGDSIVARYRNADGTRAENRETNVLDYGCLPGHEHELLDLLRAWCAYTAERGWQEVVVFSSPGSRSRPIIEQLNFVVTPFDFWTPGIPEPPGAGSRGLYVDPIYF